MQPGSNYHFLPCQHGWGYGSIQTGTETWTKPACGTCENARDSWREVDTIRHMQRYVLCYCALWTFRGQCNVTQCADRVLAYHYVRITHCVQCKTHYTKHCVIIPLWMLQWAYVLLETVLLPFNINIRTYMYITCIHIPSAMVPSALSLAEQLLERSDSL